MKKWSMVNGPLGRRTLATKGTQEWSMVNGSHIPPPAHLLRLQGALLRSPPQIPPDAGAQSEASAEDRYCRRWRDAADD